MEMVHDIANSQAVWAILCIVLAGGGYSCFMEFHSEKGRQADATFRALE